MNFINYIKTCIYRRNYKKVLQNLKKHYGKRPLKVIFIVTENQKWGYQSLYDLLSQDKNFTPLVLISVLKDVHKGKDKVRLNMDENYNFFKSRNMNVEYLYKDNKYTDLRKFNPDIVFYEQPWGIPKINKPDVVCKYALCCYSPYSIAANKLAVKGKNTFFNALWKYFIAHECLLSELEDAIPYNKESICVTGHPKLDVFRDNNYENKEHYIIYAPHHSVGNSLLKLATFDWSGKFMLEYAKAHPEINWVFKPHPNLKSNFVISKYMPREEIENYFDEWAKIGKVYTQGDYFDIFKNSDGMITDCSSFLTEYFMTGKPLIHLVSHRSAQHHPLNTLISDNYYKAFNKETLEGYLDEIIIHKNDFLKQTRLKQMKKIFPSKFNSGERIINYIKEELEIA